jgi:hypothetical protein
MRRATRAPSCLGPVPSPEVPGRFVSALAGMDFDDVQKR